MEPLLNLTLFSALTVSHALYKRTSWYLNSVTVIDVPVNTVRSSHNCTRADNQEIRVKKSWKGTMPGLITFPDLKRNSDKNKKASGFEWWSCNKQAMNWAWEFNVVRDITRASSLNVLMRHMPVILVTIWNTWNVYIIFCIYPKFQIFTIILWF